MTNKIYLLVMILWIIVLPMKVQADGSTGEKQMHQVSRAASQISNGVYIYDIDGYVTKPNDWNTANNSKVVGVALVTSKVKVIIAPKHASSTRLVWGANGLVDGVCTTSANGVNDVPGEALTDYAGQSNTTLINKKLSSGSNTAVKVAAAYTFANGKKGYLPALGEMVEIYNNRTKIDEALSLVGGTQFINFYYWTSSQHYLDYRAWAKNFADGRNFAQLRNDNNPVSDTYDVTPCWVRALQALPSNAVLRVVATSVSLNRSSASLYPDETLQLTATVLPSNTTNKAVTWKSSNEAVATVDDNGLVTGISSGQALITATTTDGTELSATSVVTVLPRKASSITITPESVTLDISESVRLTATIAPEDVESNVLLWQSSDEDVAIVTSTGMVYGVGAGQALITATTTDGSELSDTCHVTVRVPFELSAQSVAVPVNTLRNIPVIIDNHVAVKSFAFTLTVPEGIDYFGDAIAAPRCSDFNITTTYNADSTVIHIEGEMTNQAMSAGKAPFVLLPIKSSKYIDTFELSLSDISFVSTNDGVGTQELDDITVTMRVMNLGDVNGDKAVDIGDVNALINFILGVETDLTNFGVGDMNNDGIIDVADVNLIINLILGLWNE